MLNELLEKIKDELLEGETITMGNGLLVVNSNNFARHLSIAWHNDYAYAILNDSRKEYYGADAATWALNIVLKRLKK